MSDDLKNARRNMILFFIGLLVLGAGITWIAIGGLGGKYPSKSTPTCSDDQTISLLKQIIEKKRPNYMVNALHVSNVATISKTDSGNSYTCSAVFGFRPEDDIPFQYSVTMADSKDSFVVRILN